MAKNDNSMVLCDLVLQKIEKQFVNSVHKGYIAVSSLKILNAFLKLGKHPKRKRCKNTMETHQAASTINRSKKMKWSICNATSFALLWKVGKVNSSVLSHVLHACCRQWLCFSGHAIPFGSQKSVVWMKGLHRGCSYCLLIKWSSKPVFTWKQTLLQSFFSFLIPTSVDDTRTHLKLCSLTAPGRKTLFR